MKREKNNEIILHINRFGINKQINIPSGILSDVKYELKKDELIEVLK